MPFPSPWRWLLSMRLCRCWRIGYSKGGRPEYYVQSTFHENEGFASFCLIALTLTFLLFMQVKKSRIRLFYFSSAWRTCLVLPCPVPSGYASDSGADTGRDSGHAGSESTASLRTLESGACLCAVDSGCLVCADSGFSPNRTEDRTSGAGL